MLIKAIFDGMLNVRYSVYAFMSFLPKQQRLAPA
jgi:hypothetical protein